MKRQDRRTFMAGVVLVPTALLIGPVAGAANQVQCYDPTKLPLSQKSMRRSLGYLDASTTAGKNCSLCAFFTAAAAGCGTCQLLTNGPVYASGLCTSFAPKAKQ